MKKAATIALAGMAMATAIAASTMEASAHRARHHHRHHQQDNFPGAAIVAGTIFGLAIGAASAPRWTPYPPYPPRYGPALRPYPTGARYQPPPVGPITHAAWCASQYPGYRAADNTWVDQYGLAQICYSPY